MKLVILFKFVFLNIHFFVVVVRRANVCVCMCEATAELVRPSVRMSEVNARGSLVQLA